jgi:hypothetical protein
MKGWLINPFREVERRKCALNCGTSPTYWVIKHKHAGSGTTVYRLATEGELGLIDEAIEKGWLQIQKQPVSGVIGGQGVITPSSWRMEILHQAAGRPLASVLG